MQQGLIAEYGLHVASTDSCLQYSFSSGPGETFGSSIHMCDWFELLSPVAYQAHSQRDHTPDSHLGSCGWLSNGQCQRQSCGWQSPRPRVLLSTPLRALTVAYLPHDIVAAVSGQPPIGGRALPPLLTTLPCAKAGGPSRRVISHCRVSGD